MRQRFLGLVYLFASLACVSLAAPPASQAVDLCRYDATGQYTNDPARSPQYLFFGDGPITYDGYLAWYMDDVGACYETYNTPGYLSNFPKCDLDGDGTVSIGEVYDIYYRVHPVEQTDAVAQGACVEAFGSGPFLFCYQGRYNRAVSDIAAIMDAYPMTQSIVDGSSSGLGHLSKGFLFDELTCATPGVFPPDLFDQLNACYLAQGSASPDGSQVTVQFSNAVNVESLVQEYSDVAQQYGGTCQLSDGWVAQEDAPGFHFTEYDAKWWYWKVRYTAQCLDGHCACDGVYELWTHKDEPGVVHLGTEQDLSTSECSYPDMGTWPYPFHWDSTASRAVLNLRGADGTVGATHEDYSRAVRDLDLIGGAHPSLEHRFGWWTDPLRGARPFRQLSCSMDLSAERSDLDELIELFRAEEQTWGASQRGFIFPDDINWEYAAPLFEATDAVVNCTQPPTWGYASNKSAPPLSAQVIEEDGSGRWHWRLEVNWGGCDSLSCNCNHVYEFYTYADNEQLDDASANNPDSSGSILSEAECGMPCRSCGIEVSSVPLLVVLADFADAPIPNPADPEAGWAGMMFGNNPGEANHYWNEVSEGQFQAVPVYETFGEVGNGVIRVQLSDNQPTDNSPHDVTTEWVPELLDGAANYVDFAAYDSNGDGALSNGELSVLVVFNLNALQAGAGVGAVANIDLNYQPGGMGPSIEKYARSLWFYGSIGVNVHELAHHFFDIRDMDEPDDHLLLGDGCHGEDPDVGNIHNPSSHDGTRPTHMGGYAKVVAGFVEPTLINRTTTGVTLHSPTSGAYNVLAVPDKDGVLFVEYRPSAGYDQSIPFCAGHTTGLFVTEVSQYFQPLNLPGIEFRRDVTEYEYPNYPPDVCEFYATSGSYDDFRIGGYHFTNLSFSGDTLTLDIIKEDVPSSIQSYKHVYSVANEQGNLWGSHFVEALEGGVTQIDFTDLWNGTDASRSFSFGLQGYLNTGESRSLNREAKWTTTSDYLEISKIDNMGGGDGAYLWDRAILFRFNPLVPSTSSAFVTVEHKGFRATLELINLPTYP